MIFIGIDPGKKGGLAAVDDRGKLVIKHATPEADLDILNAVRYMAGLQGSEATRGVLEKVHASPQMGVSSAFSFGGSYRAVRMALVAAGVTFEEVTPQRWQRVMECLTGGDKNVSKDRAKHLFPGEHITHDTADAILLAEYARRYWTTS